MTRAYVKESRAWIYSQPKGGPFHIPYFLPKDVVGLIWMWESAPKAGVHMAHECSSGLNNDMIFLERIQICIKSLKYLPAGARFVRAALLAQASSLIRAMICKLTPIGTLSIYLMKVLPT